MTGVVGRERELSLAAEFLDLAGERFAALVIEGDAGIGKTTVWRETVRRAEERGFVVLRCRPTEKEAKLGLSAVADLLEPVPTPAFAVLPEPQRRALDIALLRADPGNTVADQRTVATAVRSLLKGLASEAPVLLAVDDVQWLDAASASTLEFALRRLQGERVGFLASRRGSEPGALRVEDLVEPDALTRACLGPLSFAGIHHLLKERLASPPSRSVLVRVHAASGGNPLFALEVGRLLEEVGVPAAGEPLPIPADIRALVTRRIGKLPSATREVLLAAAALDDPREETVRIALGRPIGGDLEPAERAQVAACERGLITFAHPLFAAAILASATAAERRRAHRRLAEAVASPPGNADAPVRSWSRSPPGRDGRRACRPAPSVAFAPSSPKRSIRRPQSSFSRACSSSLWVPRLAPPCTARSATRPPRSTPRARRSMRRRRLHCSSRSARTSIRPYMRPRCTCGCELTFYSAEGWIEPWSIASETSRNGFRRSAVRSTASRPASRTG